MSRVTAEHFALAAWSLAPSDGRSQAGQPSWGIAPGAALLFLPFLLCPAPSSQLYFDILPQSQIPMVFCAVQSLLLHPSVLSVLLLCVGYCCTALRSLLKLEFFILFETLPPCFCPETHFFFIVLGLAMFREGMLI